jgi:hypothetical protein
MEWLRRAALLPASLLWAAALPSYSQDARRLSIEDTVAFAERALQLDSGEEVHALESRWNDHPSIFVDFVRDEERSLVLLQHQGEGLWRTIKITTGEQEGGTPDIAAIGYANADRDAADELIVILAWPQRHADVSGTLYEVRIFDDRAEGVQLDRLSEVDNRFDVHSCDCEWSDGRKERYPFKTIATVKSELKRHGY